ncbi:MAG: thioesterase [Coriobacteriales bacterium]|nr:thioesterase [Coriobacteriales bacterium]
MYSFSSKVRYSECDPRGFLSVPALVNYMQDCSTFHIESMGHGVEYSNERHFAWYVSAWQIEITRLPRFCDEIVVNTQGYKLREMMAGRAFTVTTKEGELLAQADSLWFAFDTQAKQPIRIPESEHFYLTDTRIVSLPATKRKLRFSGTMRELEPVPVTEQHLDQNKHVNNAQYIFIASQAMQSVDQSFEPHRILVQYKQAARLGDVIVPHVGQDEHGYMFDLANPAGESFAAVRLEG